jgi:hypothetical protein
VSCTLTEPGKAADEAEVSCTLTAPGKAADGAKVSCTLTEQGKGEEEEEKHGDDALKVEGEGVEKQGVTVLGEHGLPGEGAGAGDPL